MENRETGLTISETSLPEPFKAKLEIANYDDYKKMNCKSVRDVIAGGNKILKISSIIKYHPNGENIYRESLALEFSKIRKLTGVKNFFDADGLEYISDYLLERYSDCLLYTSPSPRDGLLSRMPSSA